jgi:hypothetical protein
MATPNELKQVSTEVVSLIQGPEYENARHVFNYGERHYMCGGPLLFAAATVFSSVKQKNQPNYTKAGLLIVAPSGQFKSQLVSTICASFPGLTTDMPDKFTPTGIYRMLKNNKIETTTFVLNDMVMATDGNRDEKNAELLGMVALLLSEDSISRNNFKNTTNQRYRGRFGFIGACAYETYHRLRTRIMASTLEQRIFTLHYELDLSEVRQGTERLDAPGKFGKLRGCPSWSKCPVVSVPREIVYECADAYRLVGASKKNIRYDDLCAGWLRGWAHLNGKIEITKTDAAIFKAFLPIIKPQKY